MRVVFQDGIIYASYTDEEVDNIGKHKHALIEMTPQELRILHDDVTIELSTIHGAKGGEADNVVLLLDLSRKSEEALINNPDDEHRVFYVGATRAKKELWLVRSESDREYLEVIR